LSTRPSAGASRKVFSLGASMVGLLVDRRLTRGGTPTV
jgi:hypothetical protein